MIIKNFEDLLFDAQSKGLKKMVAVGAEQGSVLEAVAAAQTSGI